MLPDLPSLKQDIIRELIKYFAHRVLEHMGIFGDIPRQQLNEGNRQRIIREDNTSDETIFQQNGASSSIKSDEVHLYTAETRLQEFDRMAKELADQIQENMIKTVMDTCDKYNQVVDNAGNPFSSDALLKVFEKVQTDFDENGKPSEMFLLAPPSLANAEATVSQALENPEFLKRYNVLLEKKRMDWRDREASRKLVG